MERTFAATMSALRKARGLSQRAAAADLHISQALLSHYENGAREPGLSFVCRACRYYGVTADYMLGLSDSMGMGKRERELAAIMAELEQLSLRVKKAMEDSDE